MSWRRRFTHCIMGNLGAIVKFIATARLYTHMEIYTDRQTHTDMEIHTDKTNMPLHTDTRRLYRQTDTDKQTDIGVDPHLQ